MKLKIIFKNGVVPAMSTQMGEDGRKEYIVDDVILFELVEQ